MWYSLNKTSFWTSVTYVKRWALFDQINDKKNCLLVLKNFLVDLKNIVPFPAKNPWHLQSECLNSRMGVTQNLLNVQKFIGTGHQNHKTIFGENNARFQLYVALMVNQKILCWSYMLFPKAIFPCFGLISELDILLHLYDY